jgi:membrane protein
MIPGTVTKIAGIAILLFTATGVFAQLQHSLNQAWQVEPNPDASSWKSFLIKRILSLGMIIVIAFLLLVSLALTIIVEELVVMLRGQEAGLFAIIFGHIVNTIIALLMATLLFAALYKVLPDAELQWRDLWIGAFITALLFVLGKTLLGWYLSNSNIGASWGSAAASIIVVLVWVYYTSLIVLFGAELTQAWVSRTGSGIRPSPGAVHVYKQKVRGQQ